MVYSDRHTYIGIMKKWLVAVAILIFGLVVLTQVMESAQDIPFNFALKKVPSTGRVNE